MNDPAPQFSSVYTSVTSRTNGRLELAMVHECSVGVSLYAAGDEFSCDTCEEFYNKVHDKAGRFGTSVAGGHANSELHAAHANAVLSAKAAQKEFGSDSPEAKAANKLAKTASDTSVASEVGNRVVRGGAVAQTDAQLQALFPGRRDLKKSINPDGTFSIEGLDANGNAVSFSPKMEKQLADKWAELGPTHDQYTANLVAVGKLALGIDLRTGIVTNQAQEQLGKESSQWYHTAHNDTVNISSSTGIPLDAVVAATTALSAGRRWSGTSTGNIETARTLADIATRHINIAPTQVALDLMEYRSASRSKGVGMLGLKNLDRLKSGETISSKDLDSSTLVELMYAQNATRGHTSLQSWITETTDPNGKVGMASSPTTDALPTLFPFFTTKGTHQVKQALSVLRGEVTAREAISGPKFSSFYSNILSPNSDYSATNDVWQYRIMGANLKLNSKLSAPQSEKAGGVKYRVGTIKELTTGSKSTATAQGLMQSGLSAVGEHLGAGDAMFRDSTKMMRSALTQLQRSHPKQFGSMKLHDFQAVIWLHSGGGASPSLREAAWDNILNKLSEVGI